MNLLRIRRDRALASAVRKVLLDDAGNATAEGALLLARLREFCSADISTLRYNKQGTTDPMATAAAEGRREVWLLLQFYLNLDEGELVEIDRDYQRHMQALSVNGTYTE